MLTIVHEFDFSVSYLVQNVKSLFWWYIFGATFFFSFKAFFWCNITFLPLFVDQFRMKSSMREFDIFGEHNVSSSFSSQWNYLDYWCMLCVALAVCFSLSAPSHQSSLRVMSRINSRANILSYKISHKFSKYVLS